jgi:hypothetical protein
VINVKRILARRFVVWPIYAALALRVIMPIGYMPAPLADGLPFVPCPSGFIGGGLISQDAASSAHHRHAGHDSTASEPTVAGGGESCQFGGAFSPAAPVAESDQGFISLEQVLVQAEFTADIHSGIPALYRARAPPRS